MRMNREVPLEEQEFLKNYNPGHYERPSVTADILVFSMIEEKLHVLLIRRKNHPFRNYWAIPGGFVDIDESSEEAAVRELYEETGAKDVYLEQLYTFSAVDRDPRMRVISVAYIALVSAVKLSLVAGDDAADVRWFEVNSLLSDLKTADMLAFDHEQILTYAMKRLRGKIYYTDIAFQLLPEEFTLRELRNVFEEILNKSLHYSNFRREMVPKLIATGKYEEHTSRRPAELYRRNKDFEEECEEEH